MNKPCIMRKLKYRLNLYKKEKKRKIKPYIILFVSGFIFLFFFACIHTEKRLSYLAEELAVSQFENDISRQCHLILKDLISENNIDTSKIISDIGQSSDITVSYPEINILKSQLGKVVTEYINSYQEVVIKIPAGALISDKVFAGYGFKIPVKLIVTGSAFTDFSHEFISGGINQTKYKLSIKVTVNASLLSLASKSEKNVVVELPVIEKIIIGDVPNIMYNAK